MSKNYIVQFNAPIVGWTDIGEKFKDLENAIKYIENNNSKTKLYRIIKLVAEFEEKYDLKIHGDDKEE
ncbi:MAG: hypothetical protein ACQEQD_04485 [Bacillota bacterium]